MSEGLTRLSRMAAVVAMGALFAAWPARALAQTVSGEASAIRASVLGATTTLAGTGQLAGDQDLRDASDGPASILWVGSADVLHAVTGSSISGGGAGDYVASEASLADLALSLPGNSVSAGFAMARALAPVGGVPVGTSQIDGLQVNGTSVPVSGAPNQTIPLVGGRLIINEQVPTATGTTVNALHVVIDGLADLVIASASAGLGSGSSAPPLPLPPLRLF